MWLFYFGLIENETKTVAQLFNSIPIRICLAVSNETIYFMHELKKLYFYIKANHSKSEWNKFELEEGTAPYRMSR